MRLGNKPRLIVDCYLEQSYPNSRANYKTNLHHQCSTTTTSHHHLHRKEHIIHPWTLKEWVQLFDPRMGLQVVPEGQARTIPVQRGSIMHFKVWLCHMVNIISSFILLNHTVVICLHRLTNNTLRNIMLQCRHHHPCQ